MDFRKRLFIAFIVMTVFPILLVAGIIYGIFQFQTESLKEDFNTEIDAIQAIQNPMLLLNKITRGAYNEMSTLSETDPDRLMNTDYLTEWNETLLKRQAFLILKRNQELVYCGDQASYEIIGQYLPKKEVESLSAEGGVYLSTRISCLVKQIDFTFTNGDSGIVYIISNATSILPHSKRVFVQIIFSSIIVFLFAGLFLIIWLYAGIVRPVYKLKEATQRMKEGDLDFVLLPTGDDEIGELSMDFEQMRAHMKSEIDSRLNYDQELRDLIGNISHDLKTPLTTIKGYAEGVLDGVAATPEKQKKYLNVIKTKSMDMTRLVEELSLYAQIDCRNYPYHFEQIDPVDFIRKYIETERFELERKGITLSVENKLAEKTKIRADAEQLKRVVMNIVGNSVKYMGGKGNVFFSLMDEGRFVRIGISDTGTGIPEKEIPHIFERFYRSDVSRNSGKGGSGIGLSIVKRIVEDHGGKISAQSIVNEGTTISFTLQKIGQKEEKTNERHRRIKEGL